MTLTIIILTHNGCDKVIRCLNSLSDALKGYKDVDIVVVDNGSIDDTEQEIEKTELFSIGRVRYKKLQENRGVAGGRNIGLSLVENSRYVMFLDNDTIVGNSAINQLVDFMDKNPDVGIAAPCLRSRYNEIQKSFKGFPNIFDKALNLFGRKSTVKHGHTEVIYPFYVIGACQIFRHFLVKKIGLLDENIFFGPEDADFCMRIREFGMKVAYIPTISIIHDWQRNSRKYLFSQTSKRHIAGLFYFYKKWKRWF